MNEDSGRNDGNYAIWAPQVGDRLFIRCDGGPCTSRLVYHPAPLEIQERGGLYVLNDDGSLADWFYLFVPNRS